MSVISCIGIGNVPVIEVDIRGVAWNIGYKAQLDTGRAKLASRPRFLRLYQDLAQLILLRMCTLPRPADDVNTVQASVRRMYVLPQDIISKLSQSRSREFVRSQGQRVLTLHRTAIWLHGELRNGRATLTVI